ncbi:MAG: hypothetical protein ACK6BC_12205 [Cyanobacteriota bacterium]
MAADSKAISCRGEAAATSRITASAIFSGVTAQGLAVAASTAIGLGQGSSGQPVASGSHPLHQPGAPRSQRCR